MNHTAIITSRPVRSGKYSTPDGAICGNGDIGVILGENEKGLSIHISKSDFWLAGEKGEQDGGIKPVGTMQFEIPKKLYENYYVEQRMDDGELFCRFADEASFVEAVIFVSHKTNCIWIEINCSDGCDRLAVKFVPAKLKCGAFEKKNCDEVKFFSKSFSGNDLHFEMRLDGAVREIPNGNKRIFVISLDTDFDLKRDHERVKKYTVETFQNEREENCSWWRDFYKKSSFKSSDKFLEMNWYASQYLLAVCSLHKDFPPGLYGNFVTVDGVNWKGDYHLNYNFQGSFYGACSSNHVELTDCYTAPILDLQERAKGFSEKFLNQKGVFYPVGIGPKGMLTEKSDGVWERMFLGQRSNAVHATDIMVMRWYATYDKDYARKVYPFFIEVADFWEGYLVNRNGIYNVIHDAVHEIPYYKDDFDPKMYEEQINEENNLLTLGLLRMFFKCIISMSIELDVDEARREKWTNIVENLHDFPTYERKGKTVFRYTSKGTDWNDTNGLCIQHIYPSGQIGLHSEKTLLEIARNTFFSDDRWDDGNAGCSIYPCAARIGINPKMIIKRMKQSFDKFQLPNMLILHGGGCLENSSIASTTVNEMVLQSYEGVVTLFPAWDMDIDCSFENLRADGAFLISSSVRNGKIGETRIVSEKGRKLRIENPFDSAEIVFQGTSFVTDERIIEIIPAEQSTITIKEN